MKKSLLVLAMSLILIVSLWGQLQYSGAWFRSSAVNGGNRITTAANFTSQTDSPQAEVREEQDEFVAEEDVEVEAELDEDEDNERKDREESVITVVTESITVSEDVEEVSVEVKREGNLAGEVVIMYQSEDGADTAAGVDYEEVEGVLRWEDGEDGGKVITLPIINRQGQGEDGRSFSVVLRDEAGVWSEGTAVVVTIISV